LFSASSQAFWALKHARLLQIGPNLVTRLTDPLADQRQIGSVHLVVSSVRLQAAGLPVQLPRQLIHGAF